MSSGYLFPPKSLKTKRKSSGTKSGHPEALLNKIQQLLLPDYPQGTFVYEFEKTLREITHSRMSPDITVRDLHGKARCVVEIGYTRPEKLRAYRDFGINDVRWYDKSGNLYAEASISPVIVEYRPNPDELFYHCMYYAWAPCFKCMPDHWECEAKTYDCDHDDESEERCDKCKCDEDYCESCYEACMGAVYSHVWISKSGRGVAVHFCDDCVETRLEYLDPYGFLVDSLRSYDDFLDFRSDLVQFKREEFRESLTSFALSTPLHSDLFYRCPTKCWMDLLKLKTSDGIAFDAVANIIFEWYGETISVSKMHKCFSK